ncbi:MAG: conjugal transfer protein TraN, partial [Nitrospirota bacterium]
CFNSKLGRIINEQGRPQIGKSFGSAKDPDCEGFTPEELSKLDFSRLDLSEYINDMQSEMDITGGQLKALEGMQNWFDNQNGNSQNKSFSPGSTDTGY